MKISFPSNYLKASDLGGQPRTVTMAEVRIEDVGQTREHKHILYVEELQKGLVLNKVNTKKIMEVFGDETDRWEGGKIILYEAMVEFQGDTVPAIRVRNVPARAPSVAEVNKAPVGDTSKSAADGAFLLHAEEMAKHGTVVFESWAAKLKDDQYDELRPELERLAMLARRNDSPPKLSEEAKKISKR